MLESIGDTVSEMSLMIGLLLEWFFITFEYEVKNVG